MAEILYTDERDIELLVSCNNDKSPLYENVIYGWFLTGVTSIKDYEISALKFDIDRKLFPCDNDIIKIEGIKENDDFIMTLIKRNRHTNTEILVGTATGKIINS